MSRLWDSSTAIETRGSPRPISPRSAGFVSSSEGFVRTFERVIGGSSFPPREDACLSPTVATSVASGLYTGAEDAEASFRQRDAFRFHCVPFSPAKRAHGASVGNFSHVPSREAIENTRLDRSPSPRQLTPRQTWIGLNEDGGSRASSLPPDRQRSFAKLGSIDLAAGYASHEQRMVRSRMRSPTPEYHSRYGNNVFGTSLPGASCSTTHRRLQASPRQQREDDNASRASSSRCSSGRISICRGQRHFEPPAYAAGQRPADVPRCRSLTPDYHQRYSCNTHGTSLPGALRSRCVKGTRTRQLNPPADEMKPSDVSCDLTPRSLTGSFALCRAPSANSEGGVIGSRLSLHTAENASMTEEVRSSPGNIPQHEVVTSHDDQDVQQVVVRDPVALELSDDALRSSERLQRNDDNCVRDIEVTTPSSAACPQGSRYTPVSVPRRARAANNRVVDEAHTPTTSSTRPSRSSAADATSHAIGRQTIPSYIQRRAAIGDIRPKRQGHAKTETKRCGFSPAVHKPVANGATSDECASARYEQN